jgi:hypothetical protein
VEPHEEKTTTEITEELSVSRAKGKRRPWLFERATPPGILSRTAYDSIRKSLQTLFDRKDVRGGGIISIQSYGSFGANFHPHLHLLVSDGVFTRAGEFFEF